MAGAGPQSPPQPPPPAPPPPAGLYSSQPFPYPTTFYLNPQNTINLDLRGVRFKVDLAILRLFPESILLTMFGQAGQFPILALLQGGGRESGLGGVVSASTAGGILVNTSQSQPGAPNSDAEPQGGSTSLTRKPTYVPPMTRTTALRWQKFYDADPTPPPVPEVQQPAAPDATAASGEASGAGEGGDPDAPKHVTIAARPPGETAKRKVKVRRNLSGMPRRKSGTGESTEPLTAATTSGDAPQASTGAAALSAADDAKPTTGDTLAPPASPADADDESDSSAEDASLETASTASRESVGEPEPPEPTPLAEHQPLTAAAGGAPLAGPAFLAHDEEPGTDPTAPHLPISFDPRLFGFILEFFQVVLHSIYSPRNLNAGDDAGAMNLPSTGEAGRLLETVWPGGIPPSVTLKGPQTVIVLREELDYFVVPLYAMDKNENQGGDDSDGEGWQGNGGGGGAGDGEEDAVNIDDPLAHLPPRRLLLLALLKRGCGRWLLARRHVLEGTEAEFAGREGVTPKPHPGPAKGVVTQESGKADGGMVTSDNTPEGLLPVYPQHKAILDTLATSTDLDGTAEWGYRELEMGKCRMVSLTMLKVISKPQAEGGEGVEGDGTELPDAAAGGEEAAPPSIITQVTQGPFDSAMSNVRRPQRKCWWEVREARCTLPEGLLDEVERRAAFVAVGPENGQDGTDTVTTQPVVPAGTNPPAPEQTKATDKKDDTEAGEERAGVGGMAAAPGVSPEEEAVQVVDEVEAMTPLNLDIMVEEVDENATAAVAGSSASDSSADKGKGVVGSGAQAETEGQTEANAATPAPGTGGEGNTQKGRDPSLWWNRREQMVKLWVRRIWTLEYCTV